MPLKLAPSVVVLAVLGACDHRAVVRWLVVSLLASAFLTLGFRPSIACCVGSPFNFFGAPLKFFYPRTSC
jgi:hypothetical protein